MVDARLNDRSGASACSWSKKSNALKEALGRSRGGFTTKLHAVVDALGNPLNFILTQGQRADIKEAENLIEPYDPEAVLGDKGYDSDTLLAYIRAKGAAPVIPSKKNRKVQREIDKNLYKDRNKIERFFGRIKHYRRIATRYEKTARNYLAFVHLASIFTLLL